MEEDIEEEELVPPRAGISQGAQFDALLDSGALGTLPGLPQPFVSKNV